MNDERGPIGRPRSEHARTAVLHAVDDLLVEIGYAAMTMKAIAERAGVSRMTVYRWWSTKAEILFEASVIDAEDELSIRANGDPLADLTSYLDALIRFLAHSPAGQAYRALVGEAQHDAAVAELLRTKDVLGASARAVLDGLVPGGTLSSVDRATAQLVGPVFFWIMSGHRSDDLVAADLARTFLRDVTSKEKRSARRR